MLLLYSYVSIFRRGCRAACRVPCKRSFSIAMLNCFKGYKRCIHILYHILDFIQLMNTKFTMEQPYILPILYCYYQACWCPGDVGSQGISRDGTDPQSWNIPSVASEVLAFLSTHLNEVKYLITYTHPWLYKSRSYHTELEVLCRRMPFWKSLCHNDVNMFICFLLKYQYIKV